jgi:hypothetical protein
VTGVGALSSFHDGNAPNEEYGNAPNEEYDGEELNLIAPASLRALLDSLQHLQERLSQMFPLR